MQSATSQMLALLAANTRIPAVEVLVQRSNPSNSAQLGSQVLLDGILEITLQCNEEQSSDTMDLSLANGDGRYSPLQGTSLAS